MYHTRQKMNFIIVEDEQYWLEQLKNILIEWASSNEKNINLLYFDSGESIISSYENGNTNWDVVFFDITLKEMSGTVAAKKLRELGYKNAIIFTTNHTEIQYAKDGFDVSANQYLLKPIDVKELGLCLDKICEKTYFTFIYKGEWHKVVFRDIAYLASFGHNMIIHYLKKDKPQDQFRATIPEVLMEFPSYFARLNRLNVVNLEHIRKMDLSNIYLSNGIDLPIGKTYRESFVRSYIDIIK